MPGFEPRASRRARVMLAVLGLLTLGSLAWWLPGALALPLAVAAVAGFAFDWARTRPPPALEWSDTGEWWIGGEGPWQLLPGTVLTPWLVVLALRNGARTRRVALWPDSLPPLQWRRLRAGLRQQAAEAPR